MINADVHHCHRPQASKCTHRVGDGVDGNGSAFPISKGTIIFEINSSCSSLQLSGWDGSTREGPVDVRRHPVHLLLVRFVDTYIASLSSEGRRARSRIPPLRPVLDHPPGGTTPRVANEGTDPPLKRRERPISVLFDLRPGPRPPDAGTSFVGSATTNH